MSEKVTEHFTVSEVECKCGCGAMPSKAFMKKLEELRVLCDFPFRMSSVARCPEHNESIGGAKKSDHITRKGAKALKGAGDIKLDEFSYERRYKVIQHAIPLGFDVIEVCNAHIHVGIRGIKEGILFSGISK